MTQNEKYTKIGSYSSEELARKSISPYKLVKSFELDGRWHIGACFFRNQNGLFFITKTYDPHHRTDEEFYTVFRIN